MSSNGQSKQKPKKRRSNEEATTDKELNENSEKPLLKVERLKQQNESLSERLDEHETELDKVLQKLADVECLTEESNENKLLLGQIGKSMENRFNTMQEKLINMMDQKLKSKTKNMDTLSGKT